MAKVSFRQGIVQHLEPNFLVLNNQRVTLLSSSLTPNLITFAHGDKDYLYTERQTIVDAWLGPFTSGKDYWLYWDIDRVSGIRTFGHTLVSPIAQNTAPSSPAGDLHWFDTSINRMKVFNGASFVEAIRVFAARLINGVTFQSLSINAPIFTGTQVGLEVPTFAGSLVFDSTTGMPIHTGNDTFFTTEDKFITGVPTGASLKINSTLVPAIANQPLSRFQVVQYVDFNKIGPANAFTAGDVIVGMIEEDAIAGDLINVAIQGIIFNEEWDFSTVNAPVFIGVGGMISLTPVFPTQSLVGRVIGKQSILFSPTLFS